MAEAIAFWAFEIFAFCALILTGIVFRMLLQLSISIAKSFSIANVRRLIIFTLACLSANLLCVCIFFMPKIFTILSTANSILFISIHTYFFLSLMLLIFHRFAFLPPLFPVILWCIYFSLSMYCIAAILRVNGFDSIENTKVLRKLIIEQEVIWFRGIAYNHNIVIGFPKSIDSDVWSN